MAKRGRKPLNKKKGYFYEDEEKAIVDYIKTKNVNEKNRIYNQYLHPAFIKMISSIIRRYKLYVPDEEFIDTFEDTLSYLMTKINNFKPDKGCKAYSYCGTIAKNYLYQKNVQYSKQIKRDVSFTDAIDEVNSNYNYELDTPNDQEEAAKLIKNISSEIKMMVDNPEENQLTENEIKVGEALIDLLDNWEDVIIDSDVSNKMQKSSVLYFLREQTMMTTKDLRENMKKYKKIYVLIKGNSLKN